MPHFQTPEGYEDMRRKILKVAMKANHVDTVAFMAGFMGSMSPYNLKEPSQRGEEAIELGVNYYLTALPRNTYIKSMKRVAKEIIPSSK